MRGSAPPPPRWLVSRVCEEFHCLPAQAEQELDRDFDGVLEVIELRAYAQTRARLMSAQNEEQAPKGKMADLVMDIEFALIQERNQESHE